MKKLAIIILACMLVFKVDAQSTIKTIEHQVEKGQTLYFLSKKYDISIEDIMRFNPQIGKDMIIKEGMIVKLYSKPTPQLNVDNYKYHVVEKGQTLYFLSKKYSISVDDLIYLNQLQNPSIGIGDKLIIQNVDEDAIFKPAGESIPTDDRKPVYVNNDPVTTIPTDKKPKEVKPVQTDKGSSTITNKDVEMYKMLYDSFADSGSEQNKAKGIGNFLEQSSSKDVYLALVNGVENGQVIRVRNLMNNKVIYLKVIGSVPQKDKSNNISIKLSKAAARDLKIVEDRFLAEWTWYKKTSQSSSVKKQKSNIIISDF